MRKKEGLTNAGKKEQRQYEQLLDKAVKEGRYGQDTEGKEVDARTVAKGHSPKQGK